jgi:predicted DNA-binding antitoxin AbrB/MazE fold protein
MNIKKLLTFKGLGKNDTVMIDPEEIQGVVKAESITSILLKGGNRVNVGIPIDQVLAEIENLEKGTRKKQREILSSDPSV